MKKEIKSVMVFGTFDIIHLGHENMFKQTRELGNFVIAVVARDDTVKSIKGRAPLHNESMRVKNLKKSSLADKVILGEKYDKYAVIKKYKPDVIALGYDQFAFTYGLKKLLIDMSLNTQIQKLRPYKPEIYKSSIFRSERNHGGLEQIPSPIVLSHNNAI